MPVKYITVKSIQDVDVLNEQHLLSGVKYLRATIALNIRQMKKVKGDELTENRNIRRSSI